MTTEHARVLLIVVDGCSDGQVQTTCWSVTGGQVSSGEPCSGWLAGWLVGWLADLFKGVDLMAVGME